MIREKISASLHGWGSPRCLGEGSVACLRVLGRLGWCFCRSSLKEVINQEIEAEVEEKKYGAAGALDDGATAHDT